MAGPAPKLPVLTLDSDHLRSTGHGTGRLRAAPKGGEKAGGREGKRRCCAGHPWRVCVWLRGTSGVCGCGCGRVDSPSFGSVWSMLVCPCRAESRTRLGTWQRVVALSVATGRVLHAPTGLAREGGRNPRPAAEPSRAVRLVLVLVLPSARLWRLGADRQCGPLEPTTRAGLPLVVTMAWSVSDPSGTGRGSLQPASYRPLMLALTFDRHKNQIVQANLIVSLQTSNLGHTNRKIPLNCPTTVASVPGRCSLHSDCQTRQRLWLCYVD